MLTNPSSFPVLTLTYGGFTTRSTRAPSDSVEPTAGQTCEMTSYSSASLLKINVGIFSILYLATNAFPSPVPARTICTWPNTTPLARNWSTNMLVLKQVGQEVSSLITLTIPLTLPSLTSKYGGGAVENTNASPTCSKLGMVRFSISPVNTNAGRRVMLYFAANSSLSELVRLRTAASFMPGCLFRKSNAIERLKHSAQSAPRKSASTICGFCSTTGAFLGTENVKYALTATSATRTTKRTTLTIETDFFFMYNHLWNTPTHAPIYALPLLVL